MTNRSNDLFIFLTGAAVGAAAVFFAYKKNRDMTQKAIEDLSNQVDGLKKRYQKDPEKFKEEVVTGSKQAAAQVTSEVARRADDATKALSVPVPKTTKKVKPKKSIKK